MRKISLIKEALLSLLIATLLVAGLGGCLSSQPGYVNIQSMPEGWLSANVTGNFSLVVPTPTFDVNLATPTITIPDIPAATVQITMPTPTITVPAATVSVSVNATGAQGATGPQGADGASGRIDIMLWNYTSVGAGTWGWLSKASQYTGFCYANSGSATNLDNLNFSVWLVPGTYTVSILGMKDQFSPILQVNLAGSQIASDDWYSAAAVYNVAITHTGISVSASGAQTLQVKVNGKGSGAYQTSLTMISLWRTA